MSHAGIQEEILRLKLAASYLKDSAPKVQLRDHSFVIYTSRFPICWRRERTKAYLDLACFLRLNVIPNVK